MDDSETYIEMCEKAEEIQEVKSEFATGDIYAAKFKDYGSPQLYWDTVVVYPDPDGCISGKEHYTIWLPRQDQLQEMMGEEYAINLLYGFHHFYNNREDDYPLQFTSMEQLWLAYVMKERFGKCWSGTNWELEVGGKGGRND